MEGAHRPIEAKSRQAYRRVEVVSAPRESLSFGLWNQYAALRAETDPSFIDACPLTDLSYAGFSYELPSFSPVPTLSADFFKLSPSGEIGPAPEWIMLESENWLNVLPEFAIRNPETGELTLYRLGPSELDRIAAGFIDEIERLYGPKRADTIKRLLGYTGMGAAAGLGIGLVKAWAVAQGHPAVGAAINVSLITLLAVFVVVETDRLVRFSDANQYEEMGAYLARETTRLVAFCGGAILGARLAPQLGRMLWAMGKGAAPPAQSTVTVSRDASRFSNDDWASFQKWLNTGDRAPSSGAVRDFGSPLRAGGSGTATVQAPSITVARPIRVLGPAPADNFGATGLLAPASSAQPKAASATAAAALAVAVPASIIESDDLYSDRESLDDFQRRRDQAEYDNLVAEGEIDPNDMSFFTWVAIGKPTGPARSYFPQHLHTSPTYAQEPVGVWVPIPIVVRSVDSMGGTITVEARSEENEMNDGATLPSSIPFSQLPFIPEVGQCLDLEVSVWNNHEYSPPRQHILDSRIIHNPYDVVGRRHREPWNLTSKDNELISELRRSGQLGGVWKEASDPESWHAFLTFRSRFTLRGPWYVSRDAWIAHMNARAESILAEPVDTAEFLVRLDTWQEESVKEVVEQLKADWPRYRHGEYTEMERVWLQRCSQIVRTEEFQQALNSLPADDLLLVVKYIRMAENGHAEVARNIIEVWDERDLTGLSSWLRDVDNLGLFDD